MKRIQDFFSLTTRERRGLMALLFLIAVVVIIPVGYKYYVVNGRENTIKVQISSVNEKEYNKTDALPDVEEAFFERSKNPVPSKASLFPFNPNNLPIEQWRALGFSDKQIRVIKNYEAKGGYFYTKADVAKVYSISESDFKRIEPYLRFEKQAEVYTVSEEGSPTTVIAKTTPSYIDINHADTTGFKSLRGIGSVFAGRIVRFRNALGGFHRKEQLREVYGFSEDLYDAIQDQLVLEDARVRKLSINDIAADSLSKHPYISRKQADLIVNYRLQHGVFRSIDNLRAILALDDDFLRKIEPYLAFE